MGFNVDHSVRSFVNYVPWNDGRFTKFYNKIRHNMSKEGYDSIRQTTLCLKLTDFTPKCVFIR